jgi:hypothetical protein
LQLLNSKPTSESYEFDSASREVPPFTKQDTGMPLLSLLFEGREIRLHESTMMQGLQLTGEISQLEGTPIFLGKRLLLFDQAVPGGSLALRKILDVIKKAFLFSRFA